MICFHVYKLLTQCTQYGKLQLHAKVCEKCGTKDNPLEVEKMGKVGTSKVLPALKKLILSFLVQDYYMIPGLLK